MGNALHVLLIDEDVSDRSLVKEELRRAFRKVVITQTGSRHDLEAALDHGAFDLAITGVRLSWGDGLSILRTVKGRSPDCPVIMLTPVGEEELAIEAVKAGLDDYVFQQDHHLARLAGAVRLAVERRRQQQALRAVEARFLDLVENAPLGLYRTTPDGTFLDANAALVHLLGYPERESLLRVNAADLYVDAADRARAIALLGSEGLLKGFAFQIRREDGSALWVEDNARAIYNDAGQIQYYEGILEDVSERKEAEIALRRSEDRFRNLVENINDFLWEIDANGIFTYISPKVREILGYGPEEVIGKSLSALPLEAGLRRALPVLPLNGSEPRPFDLVESSMHHKDGSLVLLETSGTPVFDEGGGFRGYCGVCRNVTERKVAREAVHRREAILEAVSLAAQSLMDPADWTATIQTVLSQLGKATGVSRVYLFETQISENGLPLSGQTLEWIAPAEVAAARERTLNAPPAAVLFSGVREQLTHGQAVHRSQEDFQSSERRILSRQGILSFLILPIFVGDAWWGLIGLEEWIEAREWLPAEVEAVKIAAGLIGAAVQRKRTESALLSAEMRYRTLVERALVGIYILDPNGRFLYANPGLAEISGYTPQELVASHAIDDFSPEADLTALSEFAHDLQAGEGKTFHRITHARRRDGNLIDIELEGSLITLDGKPAVIGTLRDITERKTREREMQAIVSFSTAMRSANNRAQILPVILEQLTLQFQTDGAAIVMRDPIHGDLVIEGARDAWEAAAGLHLQPGEGISGSVIASGKPFRSGGLKDEGALAHPELSARIESGACVPLIAQQQIIGALWLGRNLEFSDSDLNLLSAVSEICANAIHRATLHEQTELRLQRLTALRAIDMAITASLDVRVTLNILLGQVTSQLGIHAASVLLLNHYTQTLEFTAGRGFHSTSMQQHRVRLGEGYAGRAAVERQPVSISGISPAGDGTQRIQVPGEEFTAYYAVPLIAKGQVKGVIELYHRSPMPTDLEWMDFLQAVAAQAAIAIDNAELFDKLQRSNIELTLAYDATIEGWSRALELRDQVGEGHIQRVSELTVRLGRALGMPETELVHIRRGALLHDIGHMAIPDAILFKQGALSEDEWEIMRRHPLYAYELLSPIPYLRPALEIPYCHHEWWDGSGYPRGLKGTQIPLAARIFAVIDVWDALHSDRPYRPAWPEGQAFAHMQALAGRQFDPQVVDIFLNAVLASEPRS